MCDARDRSNHTGNCLVAQASRRVNDRAHAGYCPVVRTVGRKCTFNQCARAQKVSTWMVVVRGHHATLVVCLLRHTATSNATERAPKLSVFVQRVSVWKLETYTQRR